MAKNHWPGWRVRVSVEMDPGGPHFRIVPLTASAISETVQGGWGNLGMGGTAQVVLILVDET